MLDQVIQLIIVLFLLSMICERISDFLKHYLKCSKLFKIGDTITKQPSNNNLEEERYYRIFKINLWCGFFTAAALKADLIKFLNNIQEPGATIGWGNINSYSCLEAFLLPVGLALTGFFISFGSKFWHDLLDLLLQVKEAKRKISEVGQISIGSIADVDTFVNQHAAKYLDEFLNRFFSNIGISTFVSDYEKKLIDVYPLSSTDLSKIPKSIPFKSFDKVDIFTVVIHGDPQFSTQQGPIFPASKIANSANDIQLNFGSLGLFVWNFSKTVRHFLTCYHVVWKNHDWDFFQPNGNDQVADLLGNRCRILKAFRNTEVDVALLEAPLGIELNQQLPPFIEQNTVITSRAVTQNDKLNKTLVRMNGVASGVRTGRIINVFLTVRGIDYPDGKKWDLNNVILVASNDKKPFSIGGDSGSIVFDEQNIVIGMLVAGSSTTRQSVLIPISSIENQLLVKI